MSVTIDASQNVPSVSASASAPCVPIIGIYGISGAGKSHLLKSLQQVLRSGDFHFFEGADEIAKLAQDDLQHFQSLEQPTKEHLRQLAITKIQEKCAADRKGGVVAGHFMLWSNEMRSPIIVCTKQDLQTFTHIIYLNTDPGVIAQRRRNDLSKQRGILPLEDLHQWQEAEKEGLREVCYRNGILFTAVSTENINTSSITVLLSNFQTYSEDTNMMQAKARLHQIMALKIHPTKTMLVFDADRTLSTIDTGHLIWQQQCEKPEKNVSPLEAIFTSRLDYSHTAFRQAALLYQERYQPGSLDTVCREVASKVDLYPEMKLLLRQALREEYSGAVVITCGLQLVWEKILSRHGFSSVSVIGAGRLDDTVIDGKVKAALVTLLRESYGVRVTAFGDSPLDLQMLSRADRAVVVVGHEMNRSKRMDLELGLAINDGLLKAEQAVLSPGASPRLNTQILPTVLLTEPRFLNDVFHGNLRHTELRIIDTTSRGAAKILMTSMRDATISGPALRNAHHRAGWYLATEILPDVLGLEEYAIAHVQGHSTRGHRIRDEDKTLIVALMRGGEPMALGVSEALRSASFLHAKHASDITSGHLHRTSAVILVDSVINNGDTMIEFVRHVHELCNAVAIVALVGVVQSGSIDKLKQSHESLRHPRFSMIALRISENKFTGRGGTDTGNRLFNTTSLN